MVKYGEMARLPESNAVGKVVQVKVIADVVWMAVDVPDWQVRWARQSDLEPATYVDSLQR